MDCWGNVTTDSRRCFWPQAVGVRLAGDLARSGSKAGTRGVTALPSQPTPFASSAGCHALWAEAGHQAPAGTASSSITSGRFNSAYNTPVITLPTTIASRYNSAWLMALGINNTNSPP